MPDTKEEIVEQITATINYLDQQKATFLAEPKGEALADYVIAIHTVLAGLLTTLKEKVENDGQI